MDPAFDEEAVRKHPETQKPRPRQPCWTVKDGLVSFMLDASDAATITNLLQERVRRITWIEGAGTEEFIEVHRISRMCYEMADDGCHTDGFPTLSNLSREDVEILYALESHKASWLVNVINQFRLQTRPAGPVGPVEADLVAKDFVTVMTG